MLKREVIPCPFLGLGRSIACALVCGSTDSSRFNNSEFDKELNLLEKILIFGNSGSGKSTLAKKLTTEKNLAHLDLDILAWLPVNPPERAPLLESERKIKIFTQEHKQWVVEGGYADLLSMLIPQASQIIFMNLTASQCIENAKKRLWEPHKYESKAAQDKNLEMLIGWIKEYSERDDEFSFKSHMNLYNNFTGIKKMVKYT